MKPPFPQNEKYPIDARILLILGAEGALLASLLLNKSMGRFTYERLLKS